MNEDKLKNWIQEERAEFESESPREGIWAEIASEIQKEAAPKRRNYVAWSVAASIAALIAVVFISQEPNTAGGLAEDPTKRGTQETQEAFPLMSAEMQEAQSFYASQVNERMDRLSKYPVDADLKEEMDLLTEEFDELSEEMGQGLDDSKVVEAMIDNYRLRLELLEDLLRALDRSSEGTNKKTTREHEL